MDPNSDKAPGLGLPPPSTEQGGSVFDPAHMMHHKIEVTPIHAEMPPIATPPTLPVDPASIAAPAAAPLQMPVTDQPVAVATPAVTDDNSDDLDEEWVNKAKAIVEQTKNDPFVESRELSKVKADYLKIRYNKQIKVAEESQ